MEPDRLSPHATYERASRACDNCHAKKIKCNGRKTCAKCLSSGLSCRYERTLRRRGKPPTRFASCIARISTERNEELINPHTSREHVEDTIEEGQSSTTSMSQPGRPATATSATLLDAHNFDDFIQCSPPQPYWEIDDLCGDVPEDQPNGAFTTCNAVDFNPDLYDVTWQTLAIPSALEPETLDCSSYQKADVSDTGDWQITSAHLDQLDVVAVGNGHDNQIDASIPSRCPITLNYEPRLLNALINVFRQHFSDVFISFRDLQISTQTLTAQIVLMAALGALFTSIPDSHIMARMLVEDGQRMLEECMTRQRSQTVEASTSLVQAHLCLEMFGLCSRHKRSNEVSEAFHLALVQAVTEHESWLRSADPLKAHDAARLVLFDTIILEGYRASLLRLQPILTPPQVGRILSLAGEANPASSNQLGDTAAFRGLFHQIGSICALSWFTANAHSPVSGLSALRFWRPELIESCFQRSADMAQEEQTPSMKTLIFTNLLGLYAPVENYHALAYYMGQENTRRRDADFPPWLQKWQQSENLEVALKHATEVLEQGQIIVNDASSKEAPHDAICVFIATLTVIFSSLCSRSNSYDSRTRLTDKGHKILSRLRVDAAKAMAEIVCRLQNLKE